MLDPVVIDLGSGSKIPPGIHWPTFLKKWYKMIAGVAAVVISFSMVFVIISTVVVSNEKFKEDRGIGTDTLQELNTETGTQKSADALPDGGLATGVGGGSGTNIPVITFTASKTVTVGGKANLSWSATNNPKTCEASVDWSGDKPISGSEDTAPLTVSKSYIFIITCKTDTGTGFSKVAVEVKDPPPPVVIVTSSNGSTGSVPVVTISHVDTFTYAGDRNTITWDVTNSPTSCTATGDWSGTKPTAGPEDTASLTEIREYTYYLACTNAFGTSVPVKTTFKVEAPPPDLPLVLLSSNPVSPITPGTSVTLSYTVTNNPTSCVASGDWSGTKSKYGTSYSVGALSTIKTYSFVITCSNSAGSTNDTATILVIPNAPSVSLSLSPTSIYIGTSSTINWSSTNSPTSCTSSSDASWSGPQPSSGGPVSTGNLNTAKTYYFSLSCTNAGGTGYVNNIPLSVVYPPAPVVTLNANPIAISTGSNSTLTWSSTNSPTNCTASGETGWTGSKLTSAGNHTQSTGALNTARTYNYTLTCSNAGGSDTASTSVTVSDTGGGVVAPVITLSVSPSTIGTGSQASRSWSVTNSPTSCTASGAWNGSLSSSGLSNTGPINSAGTYTYTLTCSNSAGSDTKSAILTVIAVPVVSISVSPSSINSGSSSSITWSVTNSPTSCTASGASGWSGSKGSSGGPQTTGVISSAGTYSYTLTCTNAGGTASNTAVLTVTNAAPVYCGGLTPCYGVSDLAGHASPGNCWAWNTGTSTWPWVLNITSFRPAHPGGAKSGTLEEATAVCNHNINNILKGTASIPGFKDKNNSTTFNHSSATKNNGSGTLSSYRTGYYDASKP